MLSILSIIFSACFTVFLLSTADATISIEVEVLLWIISCYLALLTGCLLASKTHREHIQDYSKLVAKELSVVKIAGWLGVIAFIVRIIDKFYIRAAPITSDFSAILLHLNEQGSTILGFITAPFIFFCCYPYLYCLVHNIKPKLWSVVYWLPAIDVLSFGQRFVLLMSLFFFIFSNVFLCKVKRSRLVQISIISLAGVAIAMYMINNRYEQRGSDVFYSLQNSMYAFYLIVPQSILESGSTVIGLFYNILFYFQHAIFELQAAWGSGSYQYTYGAFDFPIVFKLLEIFNVHVDTWEGFSRAGIYLSMFGNVWFDFGPFALVILVAMGYFLRVSEFIFANSRSMLSLLFLCYFCYVVILMPVTSMIGYGFGNYFLASAFLYCFISLFLRSIAKSLNRNDRSVSNSC